MMSKKMATVCVSGQKNRLHNKTFRKLYKSSRENFQEEIGQFLLYLQTSLNEKEKRQYWKLFESSLKRYVELNNTRNG